MTATGRITATEARQLSSPPTGVREWIDDAEWLIEMTAKKGSTWVGFRTHMEGEPPPDPAKVEAFAADLVSRGFEVRPKPGKPNYLVISWEQTAP